MKKCMPSAAVAVLSSVLVLTACGDGPTASVAESRDAPSTFAESVDTEGIDEREIQEPDRIEQDSSSVEERQIYRDSDSYRYLESSSYIEPGMKYYVETSDGIGECSFGWTVRVDEDPDSLYNLTAGHCGDVGDEVYMDLDQTGDPAHFIHVGTFAWQLFEGESDATAGGDDYALIQFLDGAEEFMTGTPNLWFGDTQEDLELVGWEDAVWLEENQPYMCRLGFRSGLSCGEFLEMTQASEVAYDNIQDHGDSGGVVWAFDPSDPMMTTIRAVAVTSWGSTADATTAYGKTVDRVFESFSDDGMPLTIIG